MGAASSRVRAHRGAPGDPVLGLESDSNDVLLVPAQQSQHEARAGVRNGRVQRRTGAELWAAGFDEHVRRGDPGCLGWRRRFDGANQAARAPAAARQIGASQSSHALEPAAARGARCRARAPRNPRTRPTACAAGRSAASARYRSTPTPAGPRWPSGRARRAQTARGPWGSTRRGRSVGHPGRAHA